MASLFHSSAQSDGEVSSVCFLTVTWSSILGYRPVGMGGEGKYKHMHTNTDCHSIAQILLRTLTGTSWGHDLQENCKWKLSFWECCVRKIKALFMKACSDVRPGNESGKHISEDESCRGNFSLDAWLWRSFSLKLQKLKMGTTTNGEPQGHNSFVPLLGQNKYPKLTW